MSLNILFMSSPCPKLQVYQGTDYSVASHVDPPIGNDYLAIGLGHPWAIYFL